MAIDAIGMIKRIYMSGQGGIPYASFLMCFNALLEPGTPVRPKPPGPELRERFEACCMAMNIGIEDSLGREKDREREFTEIVWPVWEKAFPKADVDRFHKLVTGKHRTEYQAEQAQYMEDLQDRRKSDAASLEVEMREEAAAALEKKRVFEDLRRLAMARGETPEESEFAPSPGTHAVHHEESKAVAWAPSGKQTEGDELKLDAPRTEAPATATSAPAQAPAETAPARTEPSELPPPRVFDTVAHFIEAVEKQELPIVFTPNRRAAPYIYFRWHGHIVEVKLNESPGGFYVIFAFPAGHRHDPQIESRVESIMAELGYRRAGPGLYEKSRGPSKYKFKLEDKLVRIAFKRATPFTRETLIGAVNDVNMTLSLCIQRVPRMIEAPEPSGS